MYLNRISKQQICWLLKQNYLITRFSINGSRSSHSIASKMLLEWPPSIQKERSIHMVVGEDECEKNTKKEEFGMYHKLKRMLCDEDVNEIMVELNKCVDLKQLLDTINLHEKDFHPQSVNSAQYESLKKNVFNLITSRLQVHKTDIDEISCCYLFLRRIGVPNSNLTVQELLLQALATINEEKKTVSLAALSRLLIGINIGSSFHTPSLCCHFVPHIIKHIEGCSSDEDARLLAVCLLNLQPLVTEEILDMFKARIRQLLTAGLLNTYTPTKIILTITSLLNLSIWSSKNSKDIREMLLLLHPRINALNGNDLKVVCRIFQYQLEPAALTEPLVKAITLLLKEQPTADTLACFMSFAEPRRREPLISMFTRLLYSSDNWASRDASHNCFVILRALKIADPKICDAYWANVVNELSSMPEEETHLRFLRHCHRYMNFNNNLGGTYRFEPLERILSQMAMRTIEGDLAGRLPSKFVRLASFVLAYGHTPFCWKKFPNMILSKIISMSNQFSAFDCFLLSRGLQIALEMRFRHNVPPLIGMQLSTIDSVLTDCAERHLNDTEDLSINDLNYTVRTLGYKKSLKNTVIYCKAINKYKEIDYKDLNSRIIRELAYNLNAANTLIPETLDAMFKYIEHNHEHVIGDTVEKVLTCAYNLGYSPQSPDVLEYAAQILMRDFKYMSGLSIVQACLALCFNKTIPEDLINRVFCVNFIRRVEEEIQMCYSKATYPTRVLNLIMQLNRTVCLDFPEANVPWFQQSYLEAQLSKRPPTPSPFSEDVKRLLENILKDKTYFRCNHTTPYGYHIDFVIHFDRDKKPIPAPVETTILDRITKVAILLLKLDSFCENDLTALRGAEYLKMKHLEMMGYKVLHINEHDWNSKYMTVPDAKMKYLKCLLQISN